MKKKKYWIYLILALLVIGNNCTKDSQAIYLAEKITNFKLPNDVKVLDFKNHSTDPYFEERVFISLDISGVNLDSINNKFEEYSALPANEDMFFAGLRELNEGLKSEGLYKLKWNRQESSNLTLVIIDRINHKLLIYSSE
ncbi:MAG: hypothetical protein ABJ387_07745 [Balneola sp.]